MGADRHAKAVWLLGLVMLSLASGCASWSEQRKTVVDPIHALLHRRWPAALVSGDPAALAALFASREAAAPSAALRARFAEVKWALGDILRMDLETMRGRVVIRLDGRGTDGQPLTVIEGRDVEVVRAGDGFRISADRPDPAAIAERPSVSFADEARLRG